MSELKKLIREIMTLDPSKPAIEFHKEWRTWGELTALMESLSLVLADHGLEKGTRVGGLLRNDPDIAAALMETILSDRCLVTLNPMLPDEKLTDDIRTLETPVVFGTPQDWARPAIRQAAEEARILALVVDGKARQPVQVLFDHRDSHDYRQEDGVGIEMLTSGTTGKPKRIPLKAKNFSKMILDAANFESRNPDDPPRLRNGVSILNTPFAHIGGIFGLFLCMSAGRKACLLERFRVAEFMDAVARHRPKAVSAPPSALRMLLDEDVPASRLESLVVFRTGTAPLDPDLADAFYKRYGIPVLQNYGATEFAGGVAGWTLDDFRTFGASKRGSVGRFNPGVEGRVVHSETGKPLSHGEEGLLELRAKHLGDGKSWMRTTDLARMDSDGFLWITGRADNAIIRGGFKIIPDDVVKAMETHPAIREACVVALKDPRLGQVPAAAYLVKSGQTLSPDDLKTFLRERLAAYQVPTRIMELEEFPRTPSMKVSQPDLKKLFESAV